MNSYHLKQLLASAMLLLALAACAGQPTPDEAPAESPATVPPALSDTAVPAVTEIPDATESPTPTEEPAATDTPEPTEPVEPVEPVPIDLPSGEEILMLRELLAEAGSFFPSVPVGDDAHPTAEIYALWAELAAALDLTAANGQSFFEILSQADDDFFFDYGRSITYGFEQTIFQAVPASNDFLVEFGYGQEEGEEPVLPLPAGILIVYEIFQYDGTAIPADYYLVVAAEDRAFLLGAGNQEILELGWILADGFEPTPQSFAYLTPGRLCFVVLRHEICLPYRQPAVEDGQMADHIRAAVGELEASGIYPAIGEVHYEAVLPKITSNENCPEGVGPENYLACSANLIVTANTPDLSLVDAIPDPEGARVHPAAGIVVVRASPSRSVATLDLELVPLPPGNYLLNLLQLADSSEGLGQLVGLDGFSYYVLAEETTLESEFVADYGSGFDEDAEAPRPGDVYLAGYVWRPCTARDIEPEPSPACNVPYERTYWCVIYGWCPQYER